MTESAIAAIRALGLRRIAVLTPYITEVNERLLEVLVDEGFEVVEFRQMEILSGNEMCEVDPEFVKEQAVELAKLDVDGVFISCGALRTLDVIADIEILSGKPAVCSNQAMAWKMIRMAGIDDKVE